MILLQPTSPLRRSFMIENALIRFIEEDQDSAVSVSKAIEHPFFFRIINENNQLEKY